MRKEYFKPTVFCRQLKIEGLMTTASPGFGDDDFDPTKPIEAKKQNPIIEDDSNDDFWKGI